MQASQPEDGIPSSGLQIPPERRRELIRMSGGGDSDEEMTESISEKPQKKEAAKKQLVTIKEPQQEVSRMGRHVVKL